MDFRFKPEEEAFQKEVQEFFEKQVTEDILDEIGSLSGLGGPLGKEFVRKLGARGWLVPMLPEEYGGLGASYMYRFIILNKMHYFFPEAIILIGAQIVAPTLMAVGSEEQKKEYVPRIARGEVEFALGYTEPQAGSDLAAIDIRAVEKEDHYVIAGHKIYNTSAHYAQYHWLCARTEVTTPKHRGLTLFIVPLDSPGISITPMWTMAGERTNEVYYDDVRVPKENLVGEKNRGFYHMAVALDHERVFPVGQLDRALEELTKYVKETKRNGKLLAEDPLVRQKLAELSVEVEVARSLAYRVAWMLDSGIVPNYESSVLKVFVSDLEQRLSYNALRIMGSYGQLEPGSKHVPLEGWIERWFLSNARRTISAGSNEIQRNVIAQRGFSLPRG